MKKICASILLLFMLSFNTEAHKNKMATLQVSWNQVELGFQHHILYDKLWAEIYTGIGNQDINSRFDDFTMGLRIGFNVFSHPKNQIAVNAKFALYIPNNKYYSATIPIVGTCIRYSRIIGENNNHYLFLCTGYQHGKSTYKQQYSSNIVNISSIETFKIQPLYVSIGYGFKF